MTKIVLAFIFLFTTFDFAKADEGLWIPLLIGKNINDMQKKGLKLSAEDIYSVNQSSLKDVVMQFGSGCSATMISGDGLIITSHQCSYSAINLLSNCKGCTEDFLETGFWSTLKAYDKPVPGLSVRFLIRMERVTDEILKGIPIESLEEERVRIIERKSKRIVSNAVQNTNYEAVVKSFFSDTEYYLFVEEVFDDIRLVGVPPLSIADFGGTTDTWQWPRHSGDFALFRIYVDQKTNKSRGYDQHNAPYQPVEHTPISLHGVKENDFVMTLGFPQKTEVHETSYALKLLVEKLNIQKGNLRRVKLDIMKAAMDTSELLSRQYKLNYSIWDGFWKKAVYQNKGLIEYDVINKKEFQEQQFAKWAKMNPLNESIYTNLFENYEQLYRKITNHRLALEYINELIASVDLLRYAKKLQTLFEISAINVPLQEKTFILGRATGQLREEGKMIMNDYNETVDKQIMVAFLTLFRDSINEDFHPKFFKKIENKFDGNIKAFVDSAYAQSMIAHPKKLGSFLVRFDPAIAIELRSDPIFQIYKEFSVEEWKEIRPEYFKILEQIQVLNRKYMEGLKQMNTENLLYPDANATMRLSYGKVKAFSGDDAVSYKYYTTLKGFIQKSISAYMSVNADYELPDTLIRMNREKDFGEYADADGELHVAFLTDLHTSSGNSGAPVFNAYGELIGITIDRNAEGVMSDVIFNPEKCRTIVLDIRFILFIVEKYAGRKNLTGEMTIF